MSRLAQIIQAVMRPPNPVPVSCGCATNAEHGMCEHDTQTPESIEAAYDANCTDRLAIGIPLLPKPRLTDAERLDNYEAVTRLAYRVGGYARLITLVRNVGFIEEGREF